MCSLIPLENNACRHAAQFFVTIVIILLLGKLITLVPVMDQLQLTDNFNAAEIIWFLVKLAALAVFFLFARSIMKAIPDKGGVLSFVKGIAEPLAVLLIVIMGQSLLWQIAEPFVTAFGGTVYHSIAIFLIVCASIWLVLKAYQHALYLVDATGNVSRKVLGLIPQQHINCEQCQSKISSKSSFCNHCGYKIKQRIDCPECGESVLQGQAHCQSCGAELVVEN